MIKQGILLIVAGLFLIACKDKDNKPHQHTPAFQSSIPADGSSDVTTDIEISITFDESISLSSTHGITINDLPASAMRSSMELTTIIITAELEFQTEYTVKIPMGAVTNTQGVGLDTAAEFSFTTKAAPEEIVVSELVVANPSSQVVNVYNFLKENYGIKSISSTIANVNWNLNEAEWVHKHTGKYPAMATFDYIHLPHSPASWIDYSKTDFVEEWWANNGLISAAWHWLVPKNEESSELTYKPQETIFKASNALLEGTWENDIIKADLKKIASYLKLLQQKNIPVIWRPFHEAAGNIYEYPNGTAWFWWGTGGANSYKDLWIYMFDYFEEEGLNNLIWVWTTQTKDEAFYPGDE
ncbi:MAG TPA: glycosyl hydrolase, partial [Marinilabiliaceae bacterium]|nr:glycosyl hydrolase [Marinilabiliaceae bacterium]